VDNAETCKLKRQIRALKSALKDLASRALLTSAQVDYLIVNEPSTVERGKKIAAALNDLDLETDAALHFGLDYSFPKIEQGRAKARKLATSKYKENR